MRIKLDENKEMWVLASEVVAVLDVATLMSNQSGSLLHAQIFEALSIGIQDVFADEKKKALENEKLSNNPE